MSVLRELTPQSSSMQETLMFAPQWRADPLPRSGRTSTDASRVVVFVSDDDHRLRRLRRSLRADVQCVLLTLVGKHLSQQFQSGAQQLLLLLQSILKSGLRERRLIQLVISPRRHMAPFAAL